MPSLSNSKTGSTAQIYGNEWGSNSAVWTLDHLIQLLRVGLEPGTLDHNCNIGWKPLKVFSHADDLAIIPLSILPRINS